MCNTDTAPQTLTDAIRHFVDPDKALAFMVGLRWPDGVQCPRCGAKEVQFISTRRIWKCKRCVEKKQFSVKVGTVMEDSPIALDKWLIAIWMIVNAKNGISSYELARALGLTQKSAWFLLHRIRLGMQAGSLERKLTGEVEVDETFIGGRARNMHKGKRKAKGRGAVGKAVVMGLLERHGEVRTTVVPNTRRRTLQPEVRRHVASGSEVFTDALASYRGLDADYAHQVIDHAECYAKGKIHTNGLENFWSLFKRCVHGTYVAIEPFHLFRYLDEQSFRFNTRKERDGMRFKRVVGQLHGKRLTYKGLIGDVAEHPLDGDDVGSVRLAS
jgi:transposase-like protein